MWRRYLLIALLVVVAPNVSLAVKPDVNSRVSEFIGLLVQSRSPTLADYSRYSGECGGEGELAFALKECRSRGWGTKSTHCINFVHQHCEGKTEEPSFVLDWLRTRFATAGKQYHIVRVEPESGGTYQIQVRIGGNDFLLFYDSNPYPPGGLVVDVNRVNGRKIDEYWGQKGSRKRVVKSTMCSSNKKRWPEQ